MKNLRIAGVFGLAIVMCSVGVVAQAQEDFTLNAAFGVRVIARLAEAHVGGLIDAMHTMTATADMRTGDWDQMEDLLAQFQESVLSYDAWFLKLDGSYYKVGTGLASANLSDRAYFARVMAGETTASDLVVSRSTGRKSMVLTAPIFNGPSVIGALGVTLYLDDFSALLHDELALPDGVDFYAYQEESSVICVHADSSLLLEPIASAGTVLAPQGLEVSDTLGWVFILGTAE